TKRISTKPRWQALREPGHCLPELIAENSQKGLLIPLWPVVKEHITGSRLNKARWAAQPHELRDDLYREMNNGKEEYKSSSGSSGRGRQYRVDTLLCNHGEDREGEKKAGKGTKGGTQQQIYSHIPALQHIVLSRQSFVRRTQRAHLWRHYKEVLTSEMVWSARRTVTMSKWQDMVPNTEVLERANMSSLHAVLRTRCLRWLGHVRRMDTGCIPKDLLYGELDEGQRTTERPKLRFKDICKKDMKLCSINSNTQ
ncbi:hypothetical protein DNTS_002937, partial [Danionella cerebrum]